MEGHFDIKTVVRTNNAVTGREVIFNIEKEMTVNEKVT
jgi:hypothetical protein